MTQREVDKLITQSVTNTIDAYNTITSPYTVTLFKKVKGNNWLIEQTELDIEKKYKYIKSLLPDYDTLKLRIDPISQLKYKYITDFTINFNAIISNNESIPKISNVTAIVFDNEYPLEINEYIQTTNQIECGLFNMDLDDAVIYDAIQSSEFWIELNFNGNGSNCKLELTDFSVDISFSNDLEIERNAIYNRLEDLFDDIDLNIDDLNRTVYPDEYPVISTEVTQYEMFKTESIKCNIQKNGVPLKNVNIECYVNNIYIDEEIISNDYGDFYIPLKNMKNDFNLKCIFKGNSLINSASLNVNIEVISYQPELTLDFGEPPKTSFNYSDGTPPQLEPITLNCIVELIEGYSINATCNLKKDNQILNSYTINDINEDFNVTFDKYNITVNTVEIILEENDFYQEKKVTQSITVIEKPNATYVTPKISIASGYNNYGDNLKFRVKHNGSNVGTGSCTITINGKTKSNINPSNNIYNMPLTTTYGVNKLSKDKIYSYKVVYNGGEKIVNGSTIIYKPVTKTGTFTLYSTRSKSVWFTKYAGYPTNTNDAPYRKWYILNNGSYHQCVCGNGDYLIGSSGGTYKTPRRLKCSGLNLDLTNTNVTINSVNVTYYDSNYPNNDSLGTSNSCSVGKSNYQCIMTIDGTNYTFTDNVTVGNKSWSKHSFTKNGLNLNYTKGNNISVILTWGANTNNNTGRLKMETCKATFTFRYNQVVN